MALNDIIAKIELDAKLVSQEKVEEAESQAKKLIEEAENKIILEVQDIENSANEYADKLKSIGEKASNSEGKKLILQKKISYVDEIIKKAKQKICTLETDKYFDVILNICLKYAENGEGEIFFSERDKKRQPNDFGDKLNSKLPEGKSLKVSNETISIPNGVIIRYESFEQNCTLDAIFKEKREEITDRINTFLFS